MRIEGETQIEGAAKDWAGVEICGGAGWALPRKILKMHTWNHAFMVYSWSENLYFSHRIQEFSEEGLKSDFDLLFKLSKQ